MATKPGGSAGAMFFVGGLKTEDQVFCFDSDSQRMKKRTNPLGIWFLLVILYEFEGPMGYISPSNSPPFGRRFLVHFFQASKQANGCFQKWYLKMDGENNGKHMENPIKTDDLGVPGVPLFLETPKSKILKKKIGRVGRQIAIGPIGRLRIGHAMPSVTRTRTRTMTRIGHRRIGQAIPRRVMTAT